MSHANSLVIVADTSPLLYLSLIGERDLLHKLYGQIIVPDAVHREMSHHKAPQALHDFVDHLPTWIEIRASSAGLTLPDDLGAGERAALNLAYQLHADRVLLDDLAGRKAAESLGLKITGTLGILLDGTQKGLCQLEEALSKLALTNFHASPALLARIRASANSQR